MITLIQHNKDRLLQQKSKNLWRDRAHCQTKLGFCSNDYLSLADDVRVKQAVIKGVEQYGLGSGGSAMLAGYSKAHEQCEHTFATFLRRDKAVLFSSGYLANLGVITALADASGEIFIDRFCHASIIDGVKLSRVKFKRYQHNNSSDLEEKLRHSTAKNKFIITESIFSMEGNISYLPDYVSLAKKYKACLIIDDAHGFGILGKTGAGICEYFNLTQQDLPLIILPLGKSFASTGCIVAGDEILIDIILQFSRSYIYSTVLPPAIAYANSAMMTIIKNEHSRRQQLKELVVFFNQQAKQLKLPLLNETITPIRCIMINDINRMLSIRDNLLGEGISVAAIRPPTVPVGTDRIRISLNCGHTERQITLLLHKIKHYLTHE